MVQNAWPMREFFTVHMLMNHSSGVMRFEFKPGFLKDLQSILKEMKARGTAIYLIKSKFWSSWGPGIFKYQLPFTWNDPWKISGQDYYKLLSKEILQPLKYTTRDQLLLDSYQGWYRGVWVNNNEFGGKEKVIGQDGLFIINPQLLWTGGGIYSTTSDVARWGKELYEGHVAGTLLMLSEAVPAKPGRDSKYGLGVIIKPTPVGLSMVTATSFQVILLNCIIFPNTGCASPSRQIAISHALAWQKLATRIKDSSN